MSDPSSSSESAESASDSLNSLIANNIEGNCTSCLTNPCTDGDGESETEKRKSLCCNSVSQCAWGVLLIVMSITGFIFTPLDFMLREKLNMRPGFPPFEWWASPPDEVMLRVWVFNVTNHERFMLGLDEKMNIQEIGPIVYLEKLLHYDIKFNENSTLTYTAKRYPIFLTQENSLDLNATLIVPNLALLGMASYLHDANYIVRTGFRFLASSHGSQLFLNKTIYEYLWEYKEPVLDTSKNLAPGLVPTNNMGMLARIYSDFADQVTVKIGGDYGDSEFFKITRFRGESHLPGFDPNKCPDRIVGATEGVMYQQRINKDDILLYWRKTVCKLMPLYFDSEFIFKHVPVYRYNLSESVFDRVYNNTDCYDTVPSLPDGLSDGSKCYYNFPMVVSYPHFYTGSPPKDTYVTGLQPNGELHNSYVVLEPVTGIPFHSVARMQSNLRIHDLSGFPSEYRRFSNLVVPLFWAEYDQVDLPDLIRWTIYFMVVILPPLTIVMGVCGILLGCYLLSKQIYINKLKNDSLNSILLSKSKNVNNIAKNKIFSYEKETFLKIPS